MNSKILEKAKVWAENSAFDADFRNEISNLINSNNEEELTDRFYKELEFGTGGMRGVIGAGSNRMNIYTVRRATQGLADYINEQGVQTPSVAIAYDCRNFSDVFCKEAASVLAANGIIVHVYGELKPTPMLSYAVRELGATAGIIITASHNPPEYNGYKVSWSDGCQVTAPHDNGIIEKVNAVEDFGSIKVADYAQAMKDGMIKIIPTSLEEKYYSQVMELSLGDPELNKSLGVIYTPLHGTGNIPVRRVLKERGFENVTVVKEQELPDGNFSTVKSPNPEEVTALELAVKSAGQNDQVIVATDPDADRLGVMVKHDGEWLKLNGNQIGQLIFEYYLSKMKAQGKLPDDGVLITTIVTSDLGRKIAEGYGIRTLETLTGFKYIGSVMREVEENKSGTFIFGTEESHGYLFGDFVRDKDGVSATMLFCEMCAELHSKGLTAVDQLEKIHETYDYHEDSLVNKVIKGQAGASKILEIMKGLRGAPLKEIAGVKVVEIKDYQKEEILDPSTGGAKGKTTVPNSNVIAYYMEDGSRITARPSGTEPKIKFYFNLCGQDKNELKHMKKRYEDDFAKIIDAF